MRIVCQQTILMKYHALLVIFEKAAKFLKIKVAAQFQNVVRYKCFFIYKNEVTGMYQHRHQWATHQWATKAQVSLMDENKGLNQK